MKKLLSAVFAVILAIGAGCMFTGCGGTKKNENELWITFFKGGYGDIWVNELGRKFEQETGITVKASPDTLLIDSAENMVRNGTNFDLIFCHDLPWENWATAGYLENLTDMYAQEVETGVTFEQRILNDDVLASARYNGEYWKVPWTVGTAGMAYNITVLKKVDEKMGTDWAVNPPASYSELMACCEDIVAANVKYGDVMDSKTVTPFIWSGAEEEWQWDYILFDWWAQMAGVDAVNNWKVFNEPDFASKSSLNPDVEVYNNTKLAAQNNNVGWGEFQDAYSLWYNLIAGHTDWSNPSVASLDKDANQAAFVSGAAAFMPSACWIEYEAQAQLKASGNEIAIMPTPVVDGVYIADDAKTVSLTEQAGARRVEALAAEAGDTKVVTVGDKTYKAVSFTNSFGDSAIIPASSSNKDAAKQFLLFMARDENVKLFSKLSGGTVLPYKCDFKESDGSYIKTLDYTKVNFTTGLTEGWDNADYYAQPTKWQTNIWNIASTTTKFNTYTQHPLMLTTSLKGTAKMNSVWPGNNYYYLKAFGGDKSKEPKALFDSIYGDLKKQWTFYKNEMSV